MENCPSCPATARPAAAYPAARRHGFWSRVAQALSLRRQRRSLARLDDHILRDIGIDRGTALREAARSNWDAPQHWLR